MRYVAVLLVSIFVLTWTPGMASAQGLFGCSDIGSSGGLPILGKLFGKKKKAASCFDDPPRGPGLALYVGYLDNDGGVSSEVTTRGATIANIAQAGQQYSLSGVMLAGSGTIPVAPRMDILINGSWLIPSGGIWTNGYQRAPNGVITDSANWSVMNQWWTAGAGATFNVAGPFSVIGGFIVDSFTSHYSNPTEINGGGLPSDEADFAFRGLIPYAGGLLTQGGAAGSLTVGVIGFPLLFGDMKNTQSSNSGAGVNPSVGTEFSGAIESGYFFEIFAETAVNIRAMSFGIFAGWSATHAVGDLGSDYELLTGGALFQAASATYTMSFYRSAWVVGGKFAIDFISPL